MSRWSLTLLPNMSRQVPAFIHSLNASVMLSGGMGGRAVAFPAVRDRARDGAGRPVREAVTHYLDGGLRAPQRVTRAPSTGTTESLAREPVLAKVWIDAASVRLRRVCTRLPVVRTPC